MIMFHNNLILMTDQPKETQRFEELGEYGRIILKWIL